MIFLKENWFKLALIIIIIWLGSSYIKTLQINEYVECALSNSQHDNNPNLYGLCDVSWTHHSSGAWLIK